MNEGKYVIGSYNLIQTNHIMLDDTAEAVLTLKGQQRVKTIFSRLSPEDMILLDIAFCQAHDIPPKLF